MLKAPVTRAAKAKSNHSNISDPEAFTSISCHRRIKFKVMNSLYATLGISRTHWQQSWQYIENVTISLVKQSLIFKIRKWNSEFNYFLSYIIFAQTEIKKNSATKSYCHGNTYIYTGWLLFFNDSLLSHFILVGLCRCKFFMLSIGSAELRTLLAHFQVKVIKMERMQRLHSGSKYSMVRTRHQFSANWVQ